MAERWLEAYEAEVEIYEAFSRYEDGEYRLLEGLLAFYRFPGKTVLEVGCGSGKYTELLSPLSRKYYALDVSAPMLELAGQKCQTARNVHLLRGDGSRIPIKDSSVDVVFSSWALGSIALADAGSLQEVERVLRWGGDIWLFENHWQSPFMEMRGKAEQAWDRSVCTLLKGHGYEIAATVDTCFAFPTLEEAERILGFIFGDKALRFLAENPHPRLGHRVLIIHKQKRA
jgi:ubiquinone/menaquinone biosynthesis C-methylase UbiE